MADQIYNPLSGDPLDMQKSQFIYFILIIDFTIVFLFICFINWLEQRYLQYAEVFDKKNVEMRDFTLEFTELPFDHEFGGKDLILTAKLWNLLEYHTKQAFLQSAEGNPDLYERVMAEANWEVMDINYGKNNTYEVDLLHLMDEEDRKKKQEIHKVQEMRKKGGNEGQAEQSN